MLRHSVLLVAGLLLAAACGSDDDAEDQGADSSVDVPVDTAPSAAGAWQVVDTNGAVGVITTGSRLGWDVVVGEESWQPSADDLEAFEAGIGEAVTEAGEAEVAALLDDYTRWYSGLIVRGERQMLVWFSCVAEAAEPWLEQIPFVDGGGDCHFSAWYDPAVGTIDRVLVNGED